MRTIATLGPSVRLVVFQFLMKSAQVPAIIPPKRVSETPPLPPVSGEEVLESTPRLDIFPLTMGLNRSGNYKLVDAWKKPHEKNWGMTFVRFVFCHKKHINRSELFPDFIAQREQLEEVFIHLVADNIWATQGHLNPYFDKDGSETVHQVLMFGCAGRKPNEMVFSGGRDELNRGVGPKVRLSAMSAKLLSSGDKVAFVGPEKLPAPTSAS